LGAANNLATGHVRAALIFERARLAVMLAGAIIKRILFLGAPRCLQEFTCGADITVVPGIEGKTGTAKSTIQSVGLEVVYMSVQHHLKRLAVLLDVLNQKTIQGIGVIFSLEIGAFAILTH